MPNSWIKKFCLKVFYCEYITFKKAVNMFKHMDIVEYIYKGVVKTSYKKYTRADSTRTGHIRKNIGETASSHTYFTMSERYVMCRQIYVDHPKGESKNCLIHGPRHSSDEFKFLVDLGSKYVESRPTKCHRHNPLPIKTLIGKKIIMILLIVQWMKSFFNKIEK